MDWIKCTDRLPEPGKEVIIYITMKNFTGYPKVHIGWTSDYVSGWECPDNFCLENYEVSHWMELPNPPVDKKK